MDNLLYSIIMKIGVVIPQSKMFGGGPRLALELCQELLNAGHDVIVYTFKYRPDDKQYVDLTKGITIKHLPDEIDVKPKTLLGIRVPGFSTISKYLNEHRLAKKLAQIMDKDLDALNVHSNRQAYLVAYYYKKINNRNVPTVWQMNDLHLLEYTLCIFNQNKESGSCSFFGSLLYKIIDKYDSFFFLPAVDKISVLAEDTAKLAKKFLGRETTILRAGVRSERFPYKLRQPIKDNKIKMLDHAQFFRHRHFEDAVEALRLILDAGWDAYLTLSGDCETYKAYREYRRELEELSQKLGVADRVNFSGKVSDAIMVKQFHENDIFVYPHIFQSWGLVVFEAMSTGLPCIVSKESGAREVLIDGHDSLLIEARNPNLIANAVIKLASNAQLYTKISSNSQTLVKNSLTWKQFSDGILKLIHEIK